MYPDLRGDSATVVAGKIGGYLKSVLPGGLQKYKHVVVSDPQVSGPVTAHGLRVGCIEEIGSSHPLEHCTMLTGQDGPLSSVFTTHYQGAHKGVLSTVGGTLVGHRPPLWGTLRLGPFPAELTSLETIGVQMDQLAVVVNEVLRIDSTTHPDFQITGRLRPFINSVFATLVMYYPERVVLIPGQTTTTMPEMRMVSLRMQEGVRSYYLKSGGDGNSDLTLRGWSTTIREKFDLDNLDIPTIGPGLVAAHERNLQHTHILQQLGRSVGDLHARMTSVQVEMQFANESQRRENIALHIENDRLKRALETLTAENECLRRSLHTNASTLALTSAASSVSTPLSVPSSAGACAHILVCVSVRTHAFVGARIQYLRCFFVYNAVSVSLCCCVCVRRQCPHSIHPSVRCGCRTDYFHRTEGTSFPFGFPFVAGHG